MSHKLTDFASAHRACKTTLPHSLAYEPDTPRRRLIGKQTVSDENHQQFPDRPTPFQWICSANGQSWRKFKARTNHIATAHPGIPSTEFLSLQQPRKIFVTNCPWQQRAWTCATCRQGISNQYNRVSIWEAAKAHLRKCSQKTVRENRAALSKTRLSSVKLGYVQHYKRTKHETSFNLQTNATPLLFAIDFVDQTKAF